MIALSTGPLYHRRARGKLKWLTVVGFLFWGCFLRKRDAINFADHKFNREQGANTPCVMVPLNPNELILPVDGTLAIDTSIGIENGSLEAKT